MPLVSYAEWFDARVAFMHAMRPNITIVWIAREFDRYVGATFPAGWYHPAHLFKVTDEEACRIALMLGPHANAVARVWFIRRNEISVEAS